MAKGYADKKIHYKNSDPIKKGRGMCGKVEFNMSFSEKKKDTTCKVCRGLLLIELGKIDHLPFGGDLDKKGNERKIKNHWASIND